MNKEEVEELIGSKTGVMLYFSGRDCGVCDALRPKVENLFSENFPALERLYIDAASSPDTAAAYSVFSVPTLIVFLDGKEFIREGRSMSISALQSKLERPYSILFSQ